MNQLLGSFVFALTCWRCSCYCHKLLLNFLLFIHFWGHGCQRGPLSLRQIGCQRFYKTRPKYPQNLLFFHTPMPIWAGEYAHGYKLTELLMYHNCMVCVKKNRMEMLIFSTVFPPS